MDNLEKILVELRKSHEQSRREICKKTGINQPAFSREVSANKTKILITGNNRSTRYSLKRKIESLAEEVPVYRITSSHKLVGKLIPVYPRGFYFKSYSEDYISSFHDSLPYFLDDLGPTDS